MHFLCLSCIDFVTCFSLLGTDDMTYDFLLASFLAVPDPCTSLHSACDMSIGTLEALPFISMGEQLLNHLTENLLMDSYLLMGIAKGLKTMDWSY